MQIIFSYTTKKSREGEPVEQKRKLEKLLKKYGVEKPEEIEEKIRRGLLPEHPAYEDFLSALTYLKNI